MHHGKISADVAAQIKALRKIIGEAKVPSSRVDENLILGTWNIREFGKKKRSKAAIHLIAEIINQYDVISLVEVRDNLQDLKRVLDVLGSYWRVVLSDYNVDHAGNRERVAYVYDSRMVRFTGLAAEADPPKVKKNGVYESAYPDWWRSPYMASFTAGNFDFVMMTAHIRWSGGVSKRAEAIGHLADWVEIRRNERAAVDTDFIVVGDFNIPSRGSSAFKALTKHSLQMPGGLLKVKGTNLSEKNVYDQIVHSPTLEDRFTDRGGIIRFFKNSHKELFPEMSEKAFTYQLSDHLPLWVEVDTWIEDELIDSYLS
ncbi:endonuclease/exonuclease/phosphatase family protein [Parvibaculaceae bacterium PLY_AMNH_Bact1]|nr:endonuclease/exonuclease/phosphatase family protein [Parvibaculaceae bacterium PLY_AMNH_Bact1]